MSEKLKDDLFEDTPYEGNDLDPSLFEGEVEPETSQLEAGVRGAAQGFTSAFSDEVEAFAETTIETFSNEGVEWSTAYDKNLTEARRQNARAKAEHPSTYASSEFAGGVAQFAYPAAKLGAVGRAAAAATQSAIQFLGEAESKKAATTTEEGLKELGTRAGIGASFSGVLSIGGAVVKFLSPTTEKIFKQTFSLNRGKIGRDTSAWLRNSKQTPKDMINDLKNMKTTDGELLLHMGDDLDTISEKASHILKEVDINKNAALAKINIKLDGDEVKTLHRNIKSKLFVNGKNSDVSDVKKIYKDLDDRVDDLFLEPKEIKKIVPIKDGDVKEVTDTILVPKKNIDLSRVDAMRKDINSLISNWDANSGTVTKNKLRQISGIINEQISEIAESKAKAGIIKPEDILEFKKLKTQYGNLAQFEKGLAKSLDDAENGSVSLVREMFATSILAGGAKHALGFSSQAAVGAAIALRSGAKIPGVQIGVAKAATKLADVVENNAHKAGTILQSLAVASELGATDFRHTLHSEYSKVLLEEDPIKRNVTDVLNKQHYILAVAQKHAPDQVEALREAFDTNNDDAISAGMDQLSKLPGNNKFFKPGIGFNGKVWNEEDKVRLLQDLNSMDVSLRQKLELKRNLLDNNVVPVVQKEEMPFFRYERANKKEPKF